jgi:hypothetical protein
VPEKINLIISISCDSGQFIEFVDRRRSAGGFWGGIVRVVYFHDY